MKNEEFDLIHGIARNSEGMYRDTVSELHFMPEKYTLGELMIDLFADDEQRSGSDGKYRENWRPRLGLASIATSRVMDRYFYPVVSGGGDAEPVVLEDDRGNNCLQDGAYARTVEVDALIPGSVYIDYHNSKQLTRHNPDMYFKLTQIGVVSSNNQFCVVNVPADKQCSDKDPFVSLRGFYSAISLLVRTSDSVTWDDPLYVSDENGNWREVMGVAHPDYNEDCDVLLDEIKLSLIVA